MALTFVPPARGQRITASFKGHIMRLGKTTLAVLTAGLLGFALVKGAAAQINLTSAANTYLQTFDSLSSTGTTAPFADNSTILGLYARQFGGTGANGAPSTYNVGNGSSGSAGGLFSFGATGATDRALGSLVTNSSGGLQYGFRFVNNDASRTLTGFTIAYNGEQWRDANTTQQSLRFSYAIFSSAGDIGNETSSTTGGYVLDSRYTAVTALNFNSPSNTQSGTGTGLAIDGNTTGRTAVSSSVSGLSVARTQEVWVRYVDLNDANNDHGLSIDDFSITAQFAPAADTPEPASLILLGGGGLPLGAFWILRSRRRK